MFRRFITFWILKKNDENEIEKYVNTVKPRLSKQIQAGFGSDNQKFGY